MSHASVAFDFLEPLDSESYLPLEIVLEDIFLHLFDDLLLLVLRDVLYLLEVRDAGVLEDGL